MTEATSKTDRTPPPHPQRAAVDRLYAEHDHDRRMHTDKRVLHDPHAAVDGMWEGIGAP